MCSGAGPERVTRLTSGMQLCATALASSSRRGMTSRKAGSSRTARAVWPVKRHNTDIDMLVKSFDQIVSRISLTGGDSIAAPLRVARRISIRSVRRSSHSPTRSRFRSGERFATRPGSMTSFDEKITPPMMRSLGTAARSAPPGSRKERSGVGGWFFGRPISYHQGMPFCANKTGVAAASSGLRPAARLSTLVAFSVLITRSCSPRSAGSSEALTLAVISEFPTRSVRPFARTAFRCGPRITQATSWPACASRTEK